MKRFWTIVIGVVAGMSSAMAQSNMPISGKDSLIGCAGIIYDDGGSTLSYSNSSNSAFILKFPGADSIRLKFATLDIEAVNDSVVLFLGTDAQANKIGVFNGTILPFGGIQITLPGNRLIVKQYSDALTNAAGFALEYVGVYKKLSAQITYLDTIACVGKSLVLKSSVTGGVLQPFTYEWDGTLGVDTLLVNFPAADTVIKSLRVTDYCLNQVTVSLRVMTYEAITLGMSNDTSICLGSTITISAPVYGGDRIHGGPGFYTRWNTGERLGGITVSPKVTTTYYAWGGEGCSLEGHDSVKVTVYSPLYLSSVADTVLCFGQTYNLNLLDSGGRVSTRKVVWSDPTITGTSVVLNPDTGTTNYRVWVEDGCTVVNDTTDFVVVKRSPLQGSFILNPDTICYGDSTLVSLSVFGGRASSRVWTVNGVTVASTSYKIAPLADLEGVLEIKDGCSPDLMVKDTLMVSNSPIKHKIVASDTWQCYYDSNGFLRVSVSGGERPLTHFWNDKLSTQDTFIANLKVGKYKLISTDAFGCKDSISVNIRYEGKILVAESDTVIYRGGYGKLRVASGIKWKWLPNVAVVGSDTGEWLLVRPVKNQIYTVTTLDSASCLWRDTVQVTVVDPPLIRIPNLITPNGDGENDFWDLIEVPNLEEFDIEIYNRPGELVYRTSNYLNDWRAKAANGSDLLPGVYFYYLKNRVTELEYRGFIQVIR